MNGVVAELEVSLDKSRLDIAMIWQFLSGTHWAMGRDRAVVERTVESSACFGGYVAGCQVAFGRVVTDTVSIAYLADIFVLPGWRGRGYGKAIVEAMLGYIDSTDVKRTALRTRDAQGLYEKFGFVAVAEPAGSMWRLRLAPGGV